MKPLLLWFLHLYRMFISPLLGQHCRFFPSCSCYSQQAIERFGACHGTILTVHRLAKCHPFHPGGHDPVPESLPYRLNLFRKNNGL